MGRFISKAGVPRNYVIPAKAGIPVATITRERDSRLRRNDEGEDLV